MLMKSSAINSINWFCQQKVKEEGRMKRDSEKRTLQYVYNNIQQKIKMSPLAIHTIKKYGWFNSITMSDALI